MLKRVFFLQPHHSYLTFLHNHCTAVTVGSIPARYSLFSHKNHYVTLLASVAAKQFLIYRSDREQPRNKCDPTNGNMTNDDNSRSFIVWRENLQLKAVEGGRIELMSQ